MSKALAIKLTNEAYDLVEIGKFQEARDKLEKALTYADDIPDTHNELALVLTFLQEYATAKKHIEKAVELAPDNPKFWAALSQWHFREGEYETAFAIIITAEILDRNYPAVQIAKSQIGEKLGHSKKELNAYHKKAKELYEKYGLRSDGEPLKPGDKETYLGKKKKHSFFEKWKRFLPGN